MRTRIRTRLRSFQQLLVRKIATLFSSGQAGAWYDFGLFTQLFQDSAGTTPVTAVEQSLGKVNDQSGRGNHLLQATAGQRPLVSARVNLLTATEGNLATYPISVGNIINAVSSISGFTNSIHFNAAGVDSYAYKTATVPVGSVCTLSVFVQMDDSNAPVIGTNNANGDFCLVLNNGLVPSGSQVLTGTPNVYRVSNTFTTTVGTASNFGIVKYAAQSARTFKITGYHLEYASSASSYQQVTNTTTYNTSGFPNYSVFDGVDDNLTSSTGGGATSGFFFCAAVKPLGGVGIERHIWSDVGTNTGIAVVIDTGERFRLYAGNGTAFTSVPTTATLTIGATVLLTAWDDGTNLNVQIGSGAVAQVARPTISAGSSSFTVGKSNVAASNYFNGNIYPAIIRSGTALTAIERANAQEWVKRKAGL